jgi:23S rRNA pseudouridine1911/1915/1917 synthase
VHRIDKDTSGLLVVAKDDATHIGLSQQMAVHSVERAYRTIVYGGFAQDEGFVESTNTAKDNSIFRIFRPI